MRRDLKSLLQQKFSRVFEGVAKAGNSAPLQQIYTEVHIIEGGASEVDQEHEVRLIERSTRKQTERVIGSQDIFKPQPDSKQPIRTVLTKGVAGVGKTVLTQKFSLDWAEGKTNQDIHLLFPFTFREINVLKDSFSLVQLLQHIFSQTFGHSNLKQLQVLFILDGLDECRRPLDFSQSRLLTDPSERGSVEELLVNLIRGSLLPSARVWITTRPAAANQIPACSVSMVTEVRGFNDLQKDEYFMKRFKDEQQASHILKQIKTYRVLYNMSYIPIFGWMLSEVIQKILKQTKTPELPKTLTQMYVYFLVVQAKVKNMKFHGASGADPHWTEDTKEMVWSLGKLAFEQLMKGELIFYEFDLRECGLDAAEIARYSGVFTEVFREEAGLYQNKVYCFIHLTVQEFMAALQAHETFFSSGENLLCPEKRNQSAAEFYRSAIDLALQSPNGHLDLFLRFLLGLSLKTNQKLIQDLLTQTRRDRTNQKLLQSLLNLIGSDSTNQDILKIIKERLNEDMSSEKRLNLFHCLNELNDHSLLQQIQEHMRKGDLSNRRMSPADWSAVSFLLLSSDSDLKDFDLRKYQTSEEALLGLLPVLKASTKATLAYCALTENICSPLASVVSSSSSLKHLDLSDNELEDSGVKRLCEGLKRDSCRLETLSLSGCLISEVGGASLAAALSSAPSALRELDLSYNNLGASTEKLTVLQRPQGPLETLRLDPAGEQFMVRGLRKYYSEFTLDPNTAHRRLKLSEDKRSVRNVWGDQPYPDHEDRFTDQPQVLSSSGLRGRCYWEVQCTGDVDVAVSYRNRHRGEKRTERWFGDDDQSWSLRIDYTGRGSVWHNNRETKVSHVFESDLSSDRVGVFLDSEAGSLSFYKITKDKLILQHRFSSSFTEPLFPGFRLGYGLGYNGLGYGSMSLVNPNPSVTQSGI